MSLWRHRSWEGTDDGRTKIIIQKVRNKAAGKVGQHELTYNRETGRYKDTDDMGA